jgi:periplasmic protein TonB
MMAASRAAAHEGVLPAGRDWLWLAVVVGVHGALLVGVMIGLGRAAPPAPPPTVTGMLVAPQPPAAAASVPQETLPAAPERPKPRVAQRPREATPLAPSNAPSSERAATAPPAEPGPSPQAESTPADIRGASSPAAAPALAPAPAPVTPPRTDAAHLNNPAPQYPTVSRRFGEEGRVLFDVYILPDGRVGEIKLRRSSGHARLDEAALDAVRRWRYVPARRGSEPIPYWYVQPVAFSLNS